MTDVIRELVLPKLDRVKPSGAGFMARCPVHEDSTASLSVNRGNGQPVVFHCHAGCSPDDILSKLGLTWAEVSKPRENNAKPGVVAEYEYRDEAGTLLYVVERKAPKAFVCKRPDGAGGWIYRGAMTGVRRVLYRLPEVLAELEVGREVWVTEGEKDADRLWSMGLPATCNPHGAGKWRTEYTETLRGAVVAVVQDRDDAGREHARVVVEALRGADCEVRVVEAAEGKDLSDHLDAGRGLEEFVPVSGPEVKDDVREGVMPPRATPLDWPTFLTREQGPVDFLAGRLMVRGQQIALVGAGKAGKSVFSVEWAWRISAGLEFLGDGPRSPLRVMYVDQENPDDDIQERLLSLGATAETRRNLTYLSFPAFRPLNTVEGAADLLAAVEEYRPVVLFLDTISRMIRGKENEADPWLDLYRLALMPLKARKVSSIRLDHFGKDATRGGRGNSAKTQDVDAVWELLPVEGDNTLLQLTRTHTRNGKGHDDLLIRRHGEMIGDRWKTGSTWHGIADEKERPDPKPDPNRQYPPAALRVLGVLGAATLPLTVQQIGDQLAGQKGGPLKPRTIQDALKKLSDAGEVDEVDVQKGKASFWVVAS